MLVWFSWFQVQVKWIYWTILWSFQWADLKFTRYNVVLTTLEFNITFILGLKKEWKNICLMIRAQENFDTYSFSNLNNILKAHEYEVKEIADETNNLNFGGTLALV